MSTRKTQFKGTVQRPGQPPEDVTLILDEINPLEQIKVKTANETRTTNTVLSVDNDFADFILDIDQRYAVEGVFHLSGSPGEFDYKFAFTDSAPAGTKAFISVDDTGSVIDSGNVAIGSEERITLDTGNQLALIYGHFLSNATFGGTMQIEWAQGISSATATTFVAGSWLKITKVDTT